MTLRAKSWILASGTILATAFGVFVLPFLLPPVPIAAVSEANVAGFNNRVAIFAAAGISVLVLLMAWWSGLRISLPKEEDCKPMSRRFVLAWSLALAFTIGLLTVIVYASGYRYLDDYGYFIEQMRNVVESNRRLYTQIEFAYGPLLFYPPIWIRGLFRSFDDPIAAAYVAVLFVQELLGALALAYVMQALPIASRLRRWMFALLMVFMFIPNLGLNYTYLRFTAPAASIVFCLRGRRVVPAALLVIAGELFNLGISPEMGFAFACGATAFAIIQLVLRRQLGWLLVAFAPVAGAACFLLMSGFRYLSMLREVSGGVFNLIVAPQLYVLLYLLALVWLAPLAIVSCWRDRAEQGPLLSAIFVSGLALLPAALGRADAGHVVCSGLVLFLLALIPLSAWRGRRQWAQWMWIGAMIAVVAIAQAENMVGYGFFIRNAMRAAVIRYTPVSIRRALVRHHPFSPETASVMAAEHPQFESSDLGERVHALVGDAVVATPLPIPPSFERYLRSRSMYRPGYYTFDMSVLGKQAEQRQLADMDAAPWVLLPQGAPTIWTGTPERGAVTTGPLKYHTRRQPYVMGVLMQDDLKRNWIQVATMDGYTLYRRGR